MDLLPFCCIGESYGTLQALAVKQRASTALQLECNCMHTNTGAKHPQSYVLTCMRVCMYTHLTASLTLTCTSIFFLPLQHTHTHTHTHMHIFRYTFTLAHTHTCIYSDTHSHLHTYIHTNTHTNAMETGSHFVSCQHLATSMEQPCHDNHTTKPAK